MARVFLFNHALFPDGWAKDVRVGVDGGAIVSVERSTAERSGETVRGIAIPGLSAASRDRILENLGGRDSLEHGEDRVTRLQRGCDRLDQLARDTTAVLA